MLYTLQTGSGLCWIPQELSFTLCVEVGTDIPQEHMSLSLLVSFALTQQIPQYVLKISALGRIFIHCTWCWAVVKVFPR